MCVMESYISLCACACMCGCVGWGARRGCDKKVVDRGSKETIIIQMTKHVSLFRKITNLTCLYIHHNLHESKQLEQAQTKIYYLTVVVVFEVEPTEEDFESCFTRCSQVKLWSNSS